MLGFYFHQFELFTHKHGWKKMTIEDTSQACGLYLRAFCTGVDEILSDFRKTVVNIEQDVMRDPAIPLARITAAFQVYMLLFPALHGLLNEIERNVLHGGELLTAVHRKSISGVPCVRKALERLLFLCNTVWYNQVASWIIRGLLVDNYDELFIEQMDLSPVNQAGQLLCTWDDSDSSMDWSRFQLREQMLPLYIPLRVAERVMFIGKAVRVLQHPQAQQMQLLEHSDVEEFTELLETVRATSLNQVVMFENAVNHIRTRVAHRLWHLIVLESELLNQLQRMKDFFLLSKGEFFDAFIGESRNLMLVPPNLVNAEVDINLIFQQAAAQARIEQDPFFKRLRLVLMPPEDGAEGEGAGQSSNGAVVTDAWRCLGIKFAIEWPLHLLFEGEVLMQYNQLFGFLFLVRRVDAALHAAWAPQMDWKRLPKPERVKLYPAWRLRTNMAFLVSNLQYYLHVDVLEVQFLKLKQKITESEDFESIKQAHQDYLNSLVGQSFLQMKPIARSLDDLFSLCLQFCTYVTINAELDMDEIDAMVKQFRRFATFLLTILRGVKRKLQSSPYLTNLSQLLMRIDYNSYFSDLADRSRGL